MKQVDLLNCYISYFHNNTILEYTIYVRNISAVTRLIILAHGFTCDKNMRNDTTNNIKNTFMCCFTYTSSTNFPKNYVFHI